MGRERDTGNKESHTGNKNPDNKEILPEGFPIFTDGEGRLD